MEIYELNPKGPAARKVCDDGHVDEITYESVHGFTTRRVWSKETRDYLFGWECIDFSNKHHASLTIKYAGFLSEEGRGWEGLMDFLNEESVYSMEDIGEGLFVNADGEVFCMDHDQIATLQLHGSVTLVKCGELDDFLDKDNEAHRRFREEILGEAWEDEDAK